ncbi:MAG: hypothetical protein IT536_01665 [Hyphomicrobiales bacterium]|nr:hypothetical protein [Hyphomicrobiales bacterium]
MAKHLSSTLAGGRRVPARLAPSLASGRPVDSVSPWHAAVSPGDLAEQVAEYFIRLLTESGDLVFDPFAGSCVTAEATGRQWVCLEISEEYVQGA